MQEKRRGIIGFLTMLILTISLLGQSFYAQQVHSEAATDITDQVTVLDIKLSLRTNGTFVPINPGDTLTVGDCISIEIDWEINDLTNISAGDYFVIDLPSVYFAFDNIAEAELKDGSEVIGSWKVEDGAFKVTINATGASKIFLKDGRFSAIGLVTQEGTNEQIVVEGVEWGEITITPKPNELNPWRPNSNIHKWGHQENATTIQWGLYVNYKETNTFYETKTYTQKHNLIVTDDLPPGTTIDITNIGIKSAIIAPIEDATTTTGFTTSSKLLYADSVLHAFTLITQNIGESYDEFYARVTAQTVASYGVYNNNRLIVNLTSLPTNQVKINQTHLLNKLQSFLNDGSINQAQHDFLVDLYENELDYNVFAYQIDLAATITAGSGIYENVAKITHTNGDETSSVSTINYQEFGASITAGAPGTIKLTKKDEHGNILSGIGFQLEKKNAANNYEIYLPTDGGTAERFTDDSGLVEFGNLTGGDYRIVETTYDSTVFTGEVTYTMTNPDGAVVATNEFTIHGMDTKGFVVSVINVYAPVEITGEKIWLDEDNKDGIRPENITVRLYANDIFIKTQIVNMSTNWKYYFTNLPRFDSTNTAIIYTVVEDAVAGYTTTYEGYNIINTYTPIPEEETTTPPEEETTTPPEEETTAPPEEETTTPPEEETTTPPEEETTTPPEEETTTPPEEETTTPPEEETTLPEEEDELDEETTITPEEVATSPKEPHDELPKTGQNNNIIQASILLLLSTMTYCYLRSKKKQQQFD